MSNENSVDVVETLNDRVSAAKAVFKVKAMQKLADNEEFVETLAKQQVKAEGITTLKELVAQIDTVTEVKSRLFGYGEGIDLTVQLASSWLYAKSEVKPLIEAIVPTLPKYSEDLLLAVGRLPYYSKSLNSIIDGEPMNVLEFRPLALALANDLGVLLDTGRVRKEHAKTLYKRARLKAELSFKEASNTAALKQNVLDL